MTEPVTPEASDNLLVYSRRLDWRFLFTSPQLQHVVVAGQTDNGLLKAMQVVSDRVTRWQGQAVEYCNVLVLRNPTSMLCRTALEATNPERFYLEFEGYNLISRLRRPFDSSGCIIAARRLGYGNLRYFWHWPDIASANRIIPLSSSEALSFVIAKGRSDPKTNLKISGMELLRKTGLLAQIVNNLCIAGERQV